MRTPCLLLGAVLFATVASAQSLPSSTTRRIDSVFAGFDGTNRPGCVLGVSQQGTPVYLRGYGMSDLQHGLAINPGSIFHVASVSKQFAAFAVALLAEDGKLSLDDEVRKYVPELPDLGQRISVRHLIHHTSGIRDQWELLGLAGWRQDADLFTQDDVLEILKRQRALNFRPGEEHLYSNSGYTLLAIIVQRVSGKSLREFSEQRIFQPLGMRDTHVQDDHAMIVPNRTSAYTRGPGGGWKISIPIFDTHGATSLFTTVGDLLKWEQNFTAATVGSRGLLAEAERSSLLNNGKPTNYGFGIQTETYRGTPARGHGGADAGYRADVVRFPEHGLAIAVLCNFADATPNTYSRAVADILLEGKLAPRAADPAAGPSVTLTALQLEAVSGVYRAPGNDGVWRFEARNGALVLTNYGLPLTALGPRRFTAMGLVADFLGDSAGRAQSVRVGFGAMVVDSMVWVPPFRPSAADLAAFAGEYYSDELGVSYLVAVKDSGLVLRRPKHGELPMSPAFQDAFTVAGTGTLRFSRTRAKVDSFFVTGGRVRGVAFGRGDPRKRSLGRP